jgi:hypothetical protein
MVNDECEEDEVSTYQHLANFCIQLNTPLGDFVHPIV